MTTWVMVRGFRESRDGARCLAYCRAECTVGAVTIDRAAHARYSLFMVAISLDDVELREKTGTLAGAFLAERERWPLWIPVCLGAGIALYFSLTIEPPPYTGVFAALVSALTALALRRRLLWFLVAVALLGASIGFTAAQLRSTLVEAPVLPEKMRAVKVSGRVVANEIRVAGQRLILDHVRINGLDPTATPERLRITLRGNRDRRALPGEWVSLRATLSPPSRPAAPGAFDFARQLYFKRLGGIGFAYGGARFIDPATDLDSDGWMIALGRLRQAVTDRIRAGLGGEAGAVAAALLTGERGAISKTTLAAIRDAGLAHLLAISGLHMGLFAGIVFLVVRAALALWEPVALRHSIKKWAALAAFAGMTFYLFLSGATIPTQRAFMMGALVIAAVLLDRTAISMRSVALAAVAVLLVQPESLLGPSFQMSFAAVVALVAVFEFLRERSGKSDAVYVYHWTGRARRYFIGVCLMTVIANLATGPFAIYSFNRFAVYGLAANLVAVPLTALWIMPWGVAVLALMPFGLEALALAPMGWGIDGLIYVAQQVAAWPDAVQMLPAMPVFGLAAATVGGLWLCLWRGPWRWAGAPVFALALLTPALSPSPDLLIDGAGKLFAVRTASGELALSSRKAARYTGGIWLRREGQEESAPWLESDRLRCDNVGCIYRNHGQVIALVREARALTEDCRIASIVISAVPVRGACPSASLVIDRFDLWRNGAHALYFDDDGGFSVISVGATRGSRPWAPKK
ncbi:MAG: ComEC family competence protein [Proteobacteria bacterium]|nr:ComEC family competence protein [Pseudomonadota bacterium]